MSNEDLVIFEYPEGARNRGAWVPDLPGCVATEDSREKCGTMIAEAVELRLRGMIEDGDPIPKSTSRVGFAKVAA